MCPFLKKTAPATLRTLSTTIRQASPGGSTMSNLQILARRCPVMGKAMVVQSACPSTARMSTIGRLGGGCPYGKKEYHSKASFHSRGPQNATANETVVRKEDCKYQHAQLALVVD